MLRRLSNKAPKVARAVAAHHRGRVVMHLRAQIHAKFVRAIASAAGSLSYCEKQGLASAYSSQPVNRVRYLAALKAIKLETAEQSINPDIVIARALQDQDRSQYTQDRWEIISAETLVGKLLVQTVSHGTENVYVPGEQPHPSNSQYFLDSAGFGMCNGSAAYNHCPEGRDVHFHAVAQVKPHPKFGLRENIMIWTVRTDFSDYLKHIKVAIAACKANPDAGCGGATQYFLPKHLHPLLTPHRLIDQKGPHPRGIGYPYIIDEKTGKIDFVFKTKGVHDCHQKKAILVTQSGEAIVVREEVHSATVTREVQTRSFNESVSTEQQQFALGKPNPSEMVPPPAQQPPQQRTERESYTYVSKSYDDEKGQRRHRHNHSQHSMWNHWKTLQRIRSSLTAFASPKDVIDRTLSWRYKK